MCESPPPTLKIASSLSLLGQNFFHAKDFKFPLSPKEINPFEALVMDLEVVKIFISVNCRY